MNEKEIEGILRECLVFVEGKEAGVVTLSYADCAHAIFERLKERDEKRAEEAIWRIEKLLKEAEAEGRERVVWEGEGTVRHQRVGMKRRDMGWVNLGKNGELFIYQGEDLDGQHVQVTVRRKGGPPG